MFAACKTCKQKDNQIYRKQNPEKAKVWYATRKPKRDLKKAAIQNNKSYYKNRQARLAYCKIRHLKISYGLTPEAKEKLSVDQNHCCLGCGRHRSVLKKGLFIDHCHATQVVRGLLCDDCNLILGRARDEVSTLQNLIAYLNTFIK